MNFYQKYLYYTDYNLLNIELPENKVGSTHFVCRMNAQGDK